MKHRSLKIFQKRNKIIYWICYLVLGVIFMVVVLRFILVQRTNPANFYNENQRFRNSVIGFVREATKAMAYSHSYLAIEGDWHVKVEIYYQGELKGQGRGKAQLLNYALQEAVENILSQGLNKEELEESYFLVDISSPLEHSFIEYGLEGKELIKGLEVIRQIDKDLIAEQIKQAKEYLFRVMDPDKGGAHKYYYAQSDSFENRLHTIYTSSLLYSLLKVYDFEQDENILNYIDKGSEFILFMQNKEPESRAYGGFCYSYDLENKQKEEKYVVGTTSKTIFTLLKLYERSGDDKYLVSAELAADWLLTMQNPDGSMKSYVRWQDGKWHYSTKQSYLYNGQVLSALSKIYRVSGHEKYYQAAERIAQYIAEHIEQEGCYLGDDYRQPNPISSSWAALSLYDFCLANKTEKERNKYKEIVFKCSDELLSRQNNDYNDIFRFGRFEGCYTSSGNGWLAEVMTEVYHFCQEKKGQDCQKYKEAVIKLIRWLIQHTYTDISSFRVKNPSMAKGGLFWDYKTRYVRTDSVCHGLNAYVGIIDDLEKGTLLLIPEEIFEFLVKND